jgi:NADPH:quinone reductase
MNRPTHTFAIEISTFGAADVLKPAQRDLPPLSQGQVLIKVYAAGVNYADIMQRQGFYPPPIGVSDILGLEVSGVIIAVAKDVIEFNIGDKVCALVSGGGYAQFCIADAGSVLPIPTGLSFIEAAALPETFFTVWSNLFQRANMQKGETVFIQGGAGGIGTTAIQLAKAFGATVIVTVGSDKKGHFCTALGADYVINHYTHDFVAEIKAFTQGQGVDIILDVVGGDYFPRHLNCLNIEGRLVQIALQKGIKSEINLLPVLQKRLTITGSTLRARDTLFKAQIAQQLYTQVWSLLALKKIKPIIHCTFPLIDAYQAHQLMESRQHIGKIILEI